MVIKVFLFLFFLSIAPASIGCPLAICEKGGPIIQFPFWLQGTPQQKQRQQRNSCAPSGFNLSCNSQKYPILHIPGSGDFNLTSVNYYKRRVTLQDVEGCLLTRLLSLNLSSTPLLVIMYTNYTLFSCSRGMDHSSRGYTKAVECASNETSDVFAIGENAPYVNFSGCSKITTVPVPVSSFYFSFGIFPDDLELTWDVRDPPKGKNKLSGSSRMALILFIPILFLLIMIVGFVYMKKRGSQRNSTGTSSIQISEAGGVTSRGLDQSTIEAYTKITIVESLVDGPNCVTCTICRTDYATNDTIRFMPKCEHYFHVECIDKWLSMSRKCPVCRVSLPNANSC